MPDPQYVLRDQWGALPPKANLSPWPGGQPTGDTGHYEGAGGQPDHANCPVEVRSIQRYHQNGVYIDIAYNDVVCQHGVIFQGRDWQHFQSAAQKGGNPLHRSICYLGGPLTPFSAAAQGAVAWWHSTGPGSVQGTFIGHRDEPTCATSCPGDPNDPNTVEHWLVSGAWHSAPVPSPGPQPPPAPLPMPPQGISHPMLRNGSHGPAVMELQRKLVGVTGATIAVDGAFGPKTEQAVRNFQAFFKLGNDGIVGPKTWGLLDFFAALRGIH